MLRVMAEFHSDFGGSADMLNACVMRQYFHISTVLAVHGLPVLCHWMTHEPHPAVRP